MNVRHPMGVLHSFSTKNIFYDKIDLRFFLVSCDDMISDENFQFKIAYLPNLMYAYLSEPLPLMRIPTISPHFRNS